MRCLGCERQRQVSVPAARRVVMDANTIKTCVLAPGGERCEVRQGPTDRNSKSDANPGHSTSSFNSAAINAVPQYPCRDQRTANADVASSALDPEADLPLQLGNPVAMLRPLPAQSTSQARPPFIASARESRSVAHMAPIGLPEAAHADLGGARCLAFRR